MQVVICTKQHLHAGLLRLAFFSLTNCSLRQPLKKLTSLGVNVINRYRPEENKSLFLLPRYFVLNIFRGVPIIDVSRGVARVTGVADGVA